MPGSFWHLATAIALLIALHHYEKIPVLSAWVWGVIAWLCFNVLIALFFYGAFARQREENDV